uniref:CRAL-TRIO domain-containing protein n=1 Tax=Hirondellea gigas TaxID=1518452 RepID=A0A6A7G9X9_9CRUS
MSAQPEAKAEADAEPAKPDEARPLSEEEEKILEGVKSYLEEKDFGEVSNIMLIKFVRGYYHETPRLEKTCEILEKALIFRRDNHIDDLLERKGEAAAEFSKTCWPYHVHGRDRLGHPVYYEQTGKVDVNRLLKDYTLDLVKEYHLCMMETMDRLKAQISEETNNRTYKHIVVLDLEGFGFSHCSKTFYSQTKSLIDIDQFFYPESLVRLYIINAPFVFRALWAVVKIWVDPLTRARVFVLKGSAFLAEMKKWVDDDQIPTYYGGDCKIVDCPCREGSFEDIDRINKEKKT